MRSNPRAPGAAQTDSERAIFNKEMRFLWVGGISLIAGCVAFLLLFQSSSLWDRAIPLPGGDDGPFGAIRHLFPDEWLDARRSSPLGLLNAAIYLVILASLFTTYWLVLWRAFRFQKRGNGPLLSIGGQGNRLLWYILLVTALALFVLLWLPGTQSSDLHSYIWYGRILATFGDNPLVHPPFKYASRDAGDWLSQVYWKDVPSVYGPVWVLLAGGVAWLSNLVSSSEMWPHLLGHKLLASGAHLVNVALMWQVSGLVAERYGCPPNSDSSPDRANDVERQRGAQLVATLVYAWCPLALIEFGGNGHNDALMITGVMSALWLHLSGHWRLAAVAFGLAILVKVAALLLLPGYLWLLFWNPPTKRSSKQSLNSGATESSQFKTQDRLLIITQALLIVIATLTLLYLPFWEGPVTLSPLLGGPASSRFTNSLASMLRYNGAEWLHSFATAYGWEAIARQNVEALRGYLEGPLRLLAFSVIVPIALVATWRGRTFPLMVQGWGWVLFVYLTVGAVWFWPWYATWLLPLAGLICRGRLFTAIQLLCATSLILYAVYPLMPAPLEQVPYYRSLITIAPPLAYVAFSGLGTFLRRRKLSVHPSPSRT
ncbi:MAG TPA: hypothetical protein VEX13_05400 [Chloroflexia bacterium]|nr:hypothetical protein [Chloroflexia bacterium]